MVFLEILARNRMDFPNQGLVFLTIFTVK